MEKIKLKKRGLKIIKKSNILIDEKNKILKRLEIVKSSIVIEDEEVIELQVMKLQKLDIDDDIKAIVIHLKAVNYAKAMKDIEAYLTKYNGVLKYVDSEVQGLKLELKSLESKLQEIVEQKTEYLNDIEEFNREYNLHLGEIIKEILNLKKEILYKKTIKQQTQKKKYQEDIQTFQESKETIDELKSTIEELKTALESIDEDDENYEELSQAYHELKQELEKIEDELELQEKELEKVKEFIEDETIKQEYEEVNSYYQEFESEYEYIKESVQDFLILSDKEKKELKLLYKKAARLCHPDIVSDELKEKAHEIMQSLNDAYSKKDIKKVKEILLNLETGKSFELSSDSIEDKEILKAKIEEFKKTIQELKNEIEEIKSDDTFITISSLDDWDEYFEELRRDLEEEKEKLEIEAQEILEEKKEVEEWMKVLWEWASENNLIHHYFESEKVHLGFPKKIKEFKYLESLEISDAWTLDPDALPLGISKPIPNEICNLKYLKNLRIMVIGDNLTEDKKNWLKQLLKSGCNVGIWNGNDEYFDFDSVTLDSDIFKNDDFLIVNEQKTTTKEISYYSKYIQNIENIKFEKIRKYCENLSKDNSADEMQKYLALNGKMHKALIYSSLEVFIEKLNTETITIIDWGCDQGIASMLVLDYIKEKQLDIKVSDVILIDKDKKVLSRAITQIEALAQDTIKFTAIKSSDNNISDKIKSEKNNIILNLFANDNIPTSFWTIDYDILDESYFLCVSNENKELIDEIYENINTSIDVQDLSIFDGKIGKFDKYEKIFEVDNNGIPF